MRIPISCLALALLTASCGGVSRDEVARSHSPAGGVDAVLMETNGGATTSFGYEVYLVPAGEAARRGTRVASLYAAMRNENAYGANLRWADANTLVVEYLQARSAELTRRHLRIGGRRVRTILRAGVRDPNAPGGGMLYNLHHGSPN